MDGAGEAAGRGTPGEAEGANCVVCLDVLELAEVTSAAPAAAAPASASRSLRLCVRCVDGVAHMDCFAEWARNAPDQPLSCPLCRGPLTEQSFQLTTRHQQQQQQLRYRHHRRMARLWPNILFVVQVVFGFASLSVGIEGRPESEQRRFGVTVFVADTAVIAYMVWRHELMLLWHPQRERRRPPRRHWVNRMADSLAVTTCIVFWVLYEAERVVSPSAQGLEQAWGLQGKRRMPDDVRSTLHAAYLVLSYLMLYVFMIGAELSRSGAWMYVCACFLYACITGVSLAGGTYLSSPPLTVAFITTTCFWLACSLLAPRGTA